LNKLAKFVVCLLIFVGATQTVFAETNFSEPKKSGSFMKVGAGMLIGGSMLATFSGSQRFDEGRGAAFYSGIGVLAAGTGMLIWGFSNRSRSHSLRDSLEAAQSRSFIIGVSPLRKGGAAEGVLRW
jgi:hypothetical protein